MDKKENEKLKRILIETLWMARRYAHNRSAVAPQTINECLDLATELGVKIDSDSAVGGFYAKDGMLGEWNSKTQNFEDSL